MPGFYIGNMGEISLPDADSADRVSESLAYRDLYCARDTLNRFLDDKAFYEDECYIVIIEGVLLNKAELIADGESVAELAIRLYEQNGCEFFKCFRGSFSGAVYEKKRERWIVFTNHYGDNAVFFYQDAEGRFSFGSQVDYLLEALCASGICVTIDEEAVYAMLSYAFMTNAKTYACEIKRLLPGQYAIVDAEGFRVKTYYRPKGRRLDLSDWTEDEIIEELDRRFVAAVRREFGKDVEYGYRHLCDLSGGLDSRMTAWVAHEQGYEDCVHLTYCQSGYADEVIAEEIADRLGNELIFKPLDDARFLFDLDRLVRMNYGLGLYSGITGGESLLRVINFDTFGLEHTGQIGDVVIGSFIRDLSQNDTIEHDGAYSGRYLEKLEAPNSEFFADREQYLLETRAFLGALSSHMIRRHYTEVASPFLDVDLLDFCMSIPIPQRFKHRLYSRWILEKHPQAACFIWEKQGVALDAPQAKAFIVKAMRKIRNKFNTLIPHSRIAQKDGMNPFEYWYSSKPEIGAWMDSKMHDLKTACPSELAEEIEAFYEAGTVLEKTQALTALSAVRFYTQYPSK